MKKVEEEDLPEVKVPKTNGDMRILDPVVYDVRGTRHQSFPVAVCRMKEEPLRDFPLKNTRSMSWLLRYVVDHGGTFDGRQTKWAAEQRVDADSTAYVLHDLLGYALELGAVYDQLDMVNLASFEVLGRLYKMVEGTRGSLTMDGVRSLHWS